MPDKKYRIVYTIDDTQPQAVVRRNAKAARDLERQWLKTAGAMEGAMARGGAAAENGFRQATASADRLTKATVEGAARRLKAEVGAQEKIDVGYYKLAVDGIKMQDRMTAAARKGAADRQKFYDRANADEHGRAVKSARKDASDALGPYGRLANVRRGALTQEQLEIAAQNKAYDVAHNKRINHILKERYATQDNFRESIAAAVGFDRAVSAVGLTLAGLSVGRAVVGQIARAFTQARESADRMAEKTLATVAGLRALASVAGKRPDEAFGSDVVKFGVTTGLGAEGANRFLENFLGRAQITKGKQISETEFERFAASAGTLAQAKGVPADVAGDLFGGILKVENFKAKGQGSKEATARAAAALKILDAGSGRLPVLGPELNKALAELTAEDKLEGVFRNAGEAAVAISTAAEHNPAEAGTLVSRTAIGLRDFADKDKAKFFRRSGITDKDSFLEAVGKANKVIGEEVARGVPVDTAIKALGFNEIREVRGLKTFFGARDTVLAPQLANLADAGAPGGVEQAAAGLEALTREKTFRDAQSRARVEQAEFERGKRKSDLAIAKRDAEAELVEKGLNDSVFGTYGLLNQTAASFFTGFTKSGRDVLVENQALRNLRAQAGSAAPSAFGNGFEGLYGDTAATARGLSDAMGQRQAAAMEANNKLLEENNRLMRQQKAPGFGPAPPPLPVGAPAGVPLRP